MKVFPVIHVHNPELAVEQATIAFANNADGVYLIDHHSKNDVLLFESFNKITQEYERAYVGVNMLGLSPLEAMWSLDYALTHGHLERAPDGLWVDDAMNELIPGEALQAKSDIPSLHSTRYLGGIAFKYTWSFTEDPEAAQKLALSERNRVDVVTTSGAGTGEAPTIGKIKAMKQVTDPLAVASGISLKNINEYAGFVDEVLVASSVETRPYSGIFDDEKLHEFIQAAHLLS